jgi:hypothetical protein
LIFPPHVQAAQITFLLQKSNSVLGLCRSRTCYKRKKSPAPLSPMTRPATPMPRPAMPAKPMPSVAASSRALSSGAEAQFTAASVWPFLPRGTPARSVPASARAYKPTAHLHISAMAALGAWDNESATKPGGNRISVARSCRFTAALITDDLRWGGHGDCGWPTEGEQNPGTQE